nr:type I polyketide synthase [uncultured Halomonas sp.]
MNKRVAIIGAAHRFPGVDSTETFWQALREQRDLVTSVAPDRWGQEAFYHPDKQQPGTSYSFAAGSLGDISGFDAGFFGISPREAAQMDPQQRLMLEMTWEAMEDAGIAPRTLRGSQCGVYVGVASLDYSYRMADDMAAIDTPTATGNTSSIVSNRISYLFDLHGPSLSLDTACSSSLVAFHQACQAIRAGETDIALAGGISLHLHPYGFIIFSKASMLSPTGRCRVFDADGDGYVRSEGGGMFLLKDYDKAVADGDRILAVVAASGVNTDGDKAGLTVPNADAQVALMTDTLARAGLDANDLDYLEAHGTGTAVGDPIEARAIGTAIGQKRSRPLPIGSVKSNLGHLETASGIAGLAKALYALRFREVPATIGIKTLNPRIDFKGWNLEVVTRAQPLKPEGNLTIGINSFGFGGANAHVIVQSPPTPAINRQDCHAGDEANAALPIRLSARSEDALRQSARELSEYLGQRDIPLPDLAYSLYHRREQHPYGALLFAGDTAQVMEQLACFAEGDGPTQVVTGQRIIEAQGPVFVYSGNGCQWATMGKTLLATSPVFAAAIDEVDALFQQHADFSLRAELEGRNGTEHSGEERDDYGRSNEERLAATEIAQPALFALQVGLTRLLEAEGITPTQVTGHSVGEVAAAWACGALSLFDAVKVIYLRSAWQGQTRGQGGMTAVGLGFDAIQPWLEDPRFQHVSLAGINSPRGVTLAGATDALDRLEKSLAAERITAKRLPLDYAFHSPAMDGIREGVIDALATLTPRAGTVPFVSTVSGGLLDGASLGANYWWRNIREPVRFQAAIDGLIEDGANVFIEIGANPILRRYLNDMLAARQRSGAVIDTLSKKADAAEAMTRCIAQTLLSGVPLPATRHFQAPGAFVDLPHYPWQRERYWVRPTGESQGLMARHYEHPLLGYRLAQQELTWESQLDAKRLPWLGDHVVGDAIVFPGAGYVELALAAAQAWKAQPLIDLESLEIHGPMLLDAPHGKRMRLDIQDRDGRLRIRSREPASDEPWSLNVSARLLIQSRGLSLKRAAPALPTRSPDFDREQHLALARLIGLEYGPAFQAISHGWLTDENTVIGAVDLSAVNSGAQNATRETQQACLLPPGILDGAFQLFIPLLAQELRQAAGLAFVPVRLERLQMRLDAGEPVLVQVRLTSRAPHSLCANVELFDAGGQAIAIIEGARFKAVRLKQPSRQRLSYLDHRLVPAPRRASPLPLAADQLTLAFEALSLGYRQATGSRYAGEIEPLLDAMVLAFLREALATQADANGHIAPAFANMGAPRTGQRREALLNLAQNNGLIESQTNGWQLHEDDDDVPAATIWNLLIQDYPGHAALIHQLGRLGRHLPSRLVDDEDTDATACGSQLNSQLFQQAIGEPGWHSLTEGLGEQIEALLALLPNGQRLDLLEASAAQPRFGGPLLATIESDRSHYRFLAVTQQARAAAEILREQHPGMTLLDLEDATPDGPGAQLALVILDGSLAETRTLLERLPAHLAPEAHILLLGLAGTNWQHLLGASVDDPLAAPCSAADANLLLESLGFEAPTLLSLEEGDNGACLLHARPPASAVSLEPPLEQGNWLVISDAPARGLGDALTTGLDARGQAVIHHTASNASINELLAMFQASQIIDLRGLGCTSGASPGRRCALAMQWLQTLESSATPARLWLLTQGVSSTLGGESDALDIAEDAALWGFARSLYNEASPHSVRLIDLPVSDELSDDVLSALLDELCQPDAETEAVLDDKGQRWAPRLGLQDAPEQHHADVLQDQASTLSFELPGQLRHLRWQAHALCELGEHQVEVRVKATGLNFRDVMYALGLLSDEAIEHGFAGATLGLEFAGEVVRVGAKVERFNMGDAVVGFGPASFSDRLIADTHTLAPLPAGIDHAAAATIPTTFFTVYYALKYLARIAPGERLLIHGAAGGVGLAAVQIGRWLGAQIYATVGSDEKRDFLELLGVERLYDSRSLTFAEEILHDDPEGQGVDVVLNSLAGEAINQNLRVLKPFGRFIELGKRDFYENTHIGLRPFRNNLSYFGVDSDQLMRELPALTETLFSEMMALFADGTLTPLPYTVFDSHRVIEAFRYMQQARQIGKVVVTYDSASPAVTVNTTPGRLTLDPEASYLVTGGLSGFGLATAEWLADKGARHLILIGRSGAQREEAQQGIARLEARGVQVHAKACDVTRREDLATLLDDCRASLPPLKGIVHAATVIDDSLIRNLDEERIIRALAPKIDGARHLDALTRDDALDFFVLYSSATTLFGNPGQSSYVAANHWLEALARARRAQGRPATCVGWGAIEDVGFLARNTQTRDALVERLGGQALNSTEALSVLEQMLLNDTPFLGVLELDWHAIARFLPTADAPRYAEIARSAGDQQATKGDMDFRALLDELEPEELHAALLTLLRKELAKILLTEEDKIDPQRSIYDLGFDSLMGVELVTALEARLGLQIPVMVLSEASTLARFADYLMRKLQGQDADTETGADEASSDKARHRASLIALHGVDESQTTPQYAESDA